MFMIEFYMEACKRRRFMNNNIFQLWSIISISFSIFSFVKKTKEYAYTCTYTNNNNVELYEIQHTKSSLQESIYAY